MTIGWIGALVAFALRPYREVDRDDKDEIARLNRRIDQLGRELAIERALTAHWMGEAHRFAHQLRQPVACRFCAAQMQQAQQNAPAYGYCNCVPSRSQVLHSSYGSSAEAENRA